MAFSYVGNFPNQQVSNSGVLSLDDINNLESTGELGGSLELIEEQTISSAYADFTSLQESKYDVLMFQLEKVTPTTNGHNIGFRFSNNGGTSFISSGYQYAWQRGYPSTFTDINSTSSDRILANGGIGNGSEDGLNGYIYLYNLGNSSKYSFASWHLNGSYTSVSFFTIFSFGGGVLPTAEVHNAVRFGSDSFNTLAGGTIKLYGVKQI